MNQLPEVSGAGPVPEVPARRRPAVAGGRWWLPRVDEPSSSGENSSAVPAEKAGETVLTQDTEMPRVARSLTLTSRTLGLTATLDLAEINGQTAVPVEYRKGRPRRLDRAGDEDPGEGAPALPKVEPWPTDLVQVGLQVILLEEAGYTVPKAVLYYAAEKRRVEVLVDAPLRGQAMQTLRAAQECASGKRPVPLLNDSRCIRCSLQPICLPDEVNYQSAIGAAVKPRQIWPPLDESLHISGICPAPSRRRWRGSLM